MRSLPLLAALVLALGCAARPAPSPASGSGPAFRFPADAFAFENETFWHYTVDPASGKTIVRERESAATWSLRCGNMVRAARLFLLHARFDPAAPRADDETYAALVAQVLAHDPRDQAFDPRPVVIPGYADLYDFSADHVALLQAALGGPSTTYLQRGNWRMVFPFPRAHQAEVAATLRAEVAAGRAPIIHVLRYPVITLNHLMLVYAVEETPSEIRFVSYDPNQSEAPIVLRYDRGARAFSYPRTVYFAGGGVKVYEVYDGPLG
jgi:hypothetical protein